MEVKKPFLREMLDMGQVLSIPLFQRRYVWDREKWEPLMNDVLSLSGDKPPFRPHFMGALVFAFEQAVQSGLTKFQVIDGQQRVTTLSIMLCALRDLAREAKDEDTAKEIEAFLLNRPTAAQGDPDLRYKVRPRYWDRNDYFALVDGKRPDKLSAPASSAFALSSSIGRSEAQSTMPQAHKFFKDGFKKEIAMAEVTCRSVFDSMMDRLQFVNITMEADENHYQIFRALNFLGEALQVGDLIRNYVFMSIPSDEQEEFDKAYWRPLEKRFHDAKGKHDGGKFEQFFRYALRRHGEYFRDSDAYIKFEEWHRKEDIGNDPAALVAEYDSLATFWFQAEGGGTDLPDPRLSEFDGINDALRRVGARELHIGVAYPLVMRLLELRALGRLSDPDAAEAFRLISGFFLRRHVCGGNSRQYGSWFCEACKQLGDNPLENLRDSLAKQSGKSGGWPGDDVFQDALVQFPLYQSTRYCKAVLHRLERELERDGPSLPDPVDLDKCEVEHVMPQTPDVEWNRYLGDDCAHHEKWVHTLGNLTLLGPECNHGLGNKSFGEKLPFLSRSNIRLSETFREGGDPWRIEQIRRRGEKLAKMAARIWPGSGKRAFTPHKDSSLFQG